MATYIKIVVVVTFVVGKGKNSAEIYELTIIARINENLIIRGVANVMDPDEACRTSLKRKANLQTLELDWGRNDEDKVNAQMEQSPVHWFKRETCSRSPTTPSLRAEVTAPPTSVELLAMATLSSQGEWPSTSGRSLGRPAAVSSSTAPAARRHCKAAWARLSAGVGATLAQVSISSVVTRALSVARLSMATAWLSWGMLAMGTATCTCVEAARLH
jgi:hypothetical protein